MKNLGIISLILILFLAACKPEPPIDIIDPIPEADLLENYDPIIENITTSLRGQVIDENQEPVEGAVVKMGNLTTTTNQFGHFFFKNKTMNSKGQLVKVAVDGYFPGSRRFFPTPNTENRLSIELLPMVFDQSFDASNGGVLTLPSGGSVDFPDNSIADANGNAYTGNVNAAAKWMDPTAPNTVDQMPGNLQGVNTDSEEVGLATYGMIAVELQDDNGNPLNLGPDKTATISMPVPSDLLSTAPAQIPLWSYNESYGIWVEESVATLTNGKYVGEVSHFSFWNCDDPFASLYFELRLVDTDGNPLAGWGLTMISQTYGSSFGYTASDGTASGLIPQGEMLDLEVYKNGVCSGLALATQVGPYTQDTNYGDLVVSPAGVGVITTTIQGEVICNGNLLTDAVVTATHNGITDYLYTSNAQFQFSRSYCGTSFPVEITAYDLNNGLEGPTLTVPGGVLTNVGQIEACDNTIQSYINLDVDGVSQVLWLPYTSLSNNRTYISGNSLNDTYSYFGFDGQATGDYSNDPGTYVNVFSQIEGWNISSDSLNAAQSFDTFFVTEHSSTKIEGSFSGTMSNLATNPPTDVSVNCYFHVLQ